MGKIKERRFKVHHSALPKDIGNNLSFESSTVSALENSQNASLPVDNIFKGLDIDVTGLRKLDTDADFDVRSLSGRSHREIKIEEQHLPKKEKLRRRHERFMLKLDLIHQMKKKNSGKKNRKSFNEPAPLLVPIPKDKTLDVKIREKKLKPRASMKTRKRQREHLKDMKHFNQILNDKAFRADPINSITSFLKRKVAAERSDLDL